MANNDNPTGLIPVGYLNGAPYNGQGRMFHVPATDGTAIFVGSPVTLAATGSNTAAVVNAEQFYAPGTVADVKHAAAGAGTVPILGVCVAVEPIIGTGADQQNSTIYRAASTDRYIWVETDPQVIYEIQEDNAVSDIAAADVNLNADLIATSAGSTVTGLSGWELDSSSVAATATLDVQVLGLVNRPDNVIGTNAKWLVRINLHQYNMTDATTGSVGI